MRHKADTEVALHHGQHLRRGLHLNVGGEGEIVTQEKLCIEVMRRGALDQADDRVFGELLQGDGLLCEFRKGGTADGDFLDLVNFLRAERIRYGSALCQDRKVSKTVLHGGKAVGRGVVRQADAHVRIFAAIAREHLQNTGAQGKAAGGDVNDAALQALVGKNLRFAGLNALKGDGNVRIELFPLRREAYALRRAEEQRAAKLGFEPADHACHVGLVVVKGGGSLRKAAVFGRIVKDAVAVVTDVHNGERLP